MFIYNRNPEALEYAQTVAFATLVLAQLIHVFDCRSERSIFDRNPFENIYLLGAVLSSILLMLVVIYYPPLQPIFHTVPILWRLADCRNVGDSNFFTGRVTFDKKKIGLYDIILKVIEVSIAFSSCVNLNQRKSFSLIRNWVCFMIRSMTGFGSASKTKDGLTAAVELKSVNYRFKEVNARMPRPLLYLEDKIKQTIFKHIQRGRLELFVSVDDELWSPGKSRLTGRCLKSTRKPRAK